MKNDDSDLMTRRLRYLSLNVAKICNKLRISPNFLTITRFFILGCGAAILLFLGGYFYNLLALIFLLTNFFFDLVDGDLARNFGKKTKLGSFLDEYLDTIVINLVLLGITMNLFSSDNPLKYLSLIAISGQALSAKVADIYKEKFGISCVTLHPKFAIQRKKIDKTSVVLIELLSPRHIYFSIFSTVRYYLILGILFNILPLTISVYAIAINLRWITLFIALCLYYSANLGKKKYIFEAFGYMENSRKL